MQTKSVLTALSLSILCSTTAFGMMPRLSAVAMRQFAQQAGRTSFRSSMRTLPRSGAPRRFLSDTVESSAQKDLSFKEAWAQQTTGQKVVTGAVTTTVTAVAAPFVVGAGVITVWLSAIVADELSGLRISGAIKKLKHIRYEKQREKELFEEFKKTRR